MTVKSILDVKGRDVVTIAASKTLGEAAELLAERRIGAVIVMDRGERIGGILSERDIVRAIAQDGPAALDKSVSAVMTEKVKTCRESHTVNEVMQIMTQGRFRHLPVEESGRLVGIISIGDVVKRRIEEVEREAEQIRTYIASA
ncbi:CBS domain-containing protein [Chelativorans sp. AA-79]|uniref:CBS domain-containing protein n=1 Tax=Chelativorans sp. AA-79 TaxID=3028735 RepID=UPI0023F8D092|nr:CBS domain-containing protein [Chelativorans sp. AA-79]WEX07071.1 CBS domain-containing protein [Chelativorans sp. AA-79]